MLNINLDVKRRWKKKSNLYYNLYLQMANQLLILYQTI